MSTGDMATTAHDLLEMKRKMKEKDEKEIKQDMSNVVKVDPFEEMLFKMFEQVKNFNNILADIQRQQKEVKMDLDKTELYSHLVLDTV